MKSLQAITVEGACVMRQPNYQACQILHEGRVIQVPKVWRWLLVMQHREPGRRDAKLRCYELSQN